MKKKTNQKNFAFHLRISWHSKKQRKKELNNKQLRDDGKYNQNTNKIEADNINQNEW